MSGSIQIKEGGEGQSSVSARHLVAFQQLPDRRTMPMVERQAVLEADIREACALVRRALFEQAQKHHLAGYTENMDDVDYDVAHIGTGLKREARPTVVGHLRITRPR